MKTKIIIFSILIAMFLFCLPSYAQEQKYCPITSETMLKPVFGLVGLHISEVARLNVMNVSHIPVMVDLFICDKMNRILDHATEELLPGKSACLEYDGRMRNELIDNQVSMPVRAMVEVQRFIVSPTVVSSLEIADKATSRTNLYIHPLPKMLH